jgi:threonine dehydratase
VAKENLAPDGLISATRGNHGQSLAYAGRRFNIPVTILVPHDNNAEKNAAMKAFGARLIEHGTDFDAARVEAMRLAEAEGLYLSPSFHRDLVIGVATWALELFEAAPRLEVLYVPIGMGSGICGAILVRDLLGLSTEIVGVQSANAPAYKLSFDAGRVIETNSADTNADGLATRVPSPEALEIIRKGASRIITVTDEEIAHAVRAYWADTHNLAEGAGAASLAGLMQERSKMRGRSVGLDLSGGNIDLKLFKSWVLSDPKR